VPILSSNQRKTLEDACSKGRHASEQAVRAALTSLAVTAERPPGHLTEDDRQLRRGLRAKARQLGDTGDNLDLLVAECAYEQWHRLLFARFLAENDLLIHPEYRAPVTLDDCEELAESIGEPDGWCVAARFAAAILPGIFRLNDPCVRLRLAPEGRLALEGVLASLPVEVFGADDALGWVYQFWQKDKRDEINASERKLGGADLGPVTQLFTENYMVRFLLENSLGAWWAARHPDSRLVKSFEYLRYGEDELPAAGSFEGWPARVAEMTVMDPCCGSGHFLVEAFSMLWQMRAEEEGLTAVEAQDAVLRDNLFGLELDQRCVQIAMFALALQAWKAGGGWRQLPVPNIACSGIPVRAAVDEWKALAKNDQRLENALVRLHILFRDADTLGSLIDPRQAAELTDRTGLQQSFDEVNWDDVEPFLQKAARVEADDPATAVLGADAAGIARAADYLSRRYTLIATNPPYLGGGFQSNTLQDYLGRSFEAGRDELAAAFVLRFGQLLDEGGTFSAVVPQYILFLKAHTAMRRWLRRGSISILARLGAGAFTSIGGTVVQVMLLVHCKRAARANATFPWIEAIECDGPFEKATRLRIGDVVAVVQHQPQTEKPFSPHQRPGLKDLSMYARAWQGLVTGDTNQYVMYFWEVDRDPKVWSRFIVAPDSTEFYRGRTSLLRWQLGSGRLVASGKAHNFNPKEVLGQRGVLIAQVGYLACTLYEGEAFNDASCPMIPNRPENLPAIWAYCSSPDYAQDVRQINQSIVVRPGYLTQVPFDVEYWRQVAAERFPDGLPEPWSDDPTQWLFEGRPEVSAEPLQVAVARLLGFRWPDQPDTDDLDGFADADGIVCVPPVAGEAPAADRVQQLLAAAYGDRWSPAKQQELLEESGSKKKDLSDWLRDDFFKQHCALFGHRPFVWHIWDAQRDGFAVLVNYHRLDRKTLEKLTYTYLGDWIERQRAEVRDEKAGAEARLAGGLKLRSSLELILGGEPPFDIYVRWKSLAEQPIGWDPDVNDGVRMNVRSFVEAGVLRSSFNIHWRKDRGTDPDGSERLNDCHFTTAEKRAARGGRV
jgi:MmeI, DNA-methyltransferase domain